MIGGSLVPVKILAVDDSATMRQIMEMTFAGEDAEVHTVSSGEQAVAAARELRPDIVFADASMKGMDGYAVAQAIKGEDGLSSTAVVVLASQHKPYDEAKGKSAGVDDHVAKPFDSQVVIDKVAQLMSKAPARTDAAKPPRTMQGAGTASAATGSPRPSAPSKGRVSKRTMAFGTSPIAPPKPPAPPAAPAPPAPPAPPKRPVLELADEPDIDVEAPISAPSAPSAASRSLAASRPAPAAPPQRPAAPSAPSAPSATSPSSVADRAEGALAGKLEGLGLSKEQLEAVLSLSREVVEQVVWEVVPDLAETLIKEEIARLTSKS